MMAIFLYVLGDSMHEVGPNPKISCVWIMTPTSLYFLPEVGWQHQEAVNCQVGFPTFPTSPPCETSCTTSAHVGKNEGVGLGLKLQVVGWQVARERGSLLARGGTTCGHVHNICTNQHHNWLSLMQPLEWPKPQ